MSCETTKRMLKQRIIHNLNERVAKVERLAAENKKVTYSAEEVANILCRVTEDVTYA